MSQVPNISVPKVGMWGGIVILVITLVIVAYFVGRWLGKNLPPKEIKPPEDKPGQTASNFNPQPLTDRLYKDIDGFGITRDSEAWFALANLSDTDFVKVMNDWDARYYNRWKQTLYQAYQDEWNLKQDLAPRFSRLELLRNK